MIKAVLFDLDGTLADTALDLGAALNRLLELHHLPIQPIHSIRQVASHGAAALIKLGTGFSTEDQEYHYWRQAFLDEYGRAFADQTVLFNGINELIHSLSMRQIKWGIVTNKPHRFTDLLIPELGFVHLPAIVVSGDTTDEAKPSTKPMFYACNQINIPASECLYVGDALRDIQAGRNAGMLTALANWGYIGDNEQIDLWGADHILTHPMQLLDII